MFVQPLFGKLSDVHQRRGGGRQPFLIGGAIATSLALTGFSQSRSQSLVLAGYLSWSPSMLQNCIKAVAVIWFVMLNVAIQPLQMASRAIVIENNDDSTQIAANVWAGRMQGLGSITGFLLASGLANNFFILCILTSVLILITAVVSASAIDQHCAAPACRSDYDSEHGGVNSLRDRIPRELWQIFVIQFFSWLGWFPFRTYYTRYDMLPA